MARPEKTGLDYFPMDTAWEINMKLVKARFKLVGVGCIVELWKEIYAQGYAIRWDEDAQLLFSSENGIDLELLGRVVDFAIEKGIFSGAILAEQGYLTSRGIQKRWKKIAEESKRKVCAIRSEIDLTRVSPGVNRQETEFPPEETEFSGGESTQSKVKESKEEKKYAAAEKSAADIPSEIADQEEPDPTDPTRALIIPTGLKFTRKDLLSLYLAVGPKAQEHLDRYALKKAQHGYRYANDWAGMREWWKNSGGPEKWLSGPSPPGLREELSPRQVEASRVIRAEERPADSLDREQTASLLAELIQGPRRAEVSA